MEVNGANRKEFSFDFRLVNILKIDSDTSLGASTGTSCEGQPPRKKKKLSPSTSSSSAIVNSGSRGCSGLDIVGDLLAKDSAHLNRENQLIGSGSAVGGGAGCGALDGMQEQSGLNDNGMCHRYKRTISDICYFTICWERNRQREKDGGNGMGDR